MSALARRDERGGARQQATEETRARVLRAARAAFAAHGYAGASMRTIAADAGLTTMAVYTYAASKAALFQLVYEDGIGRIYAHYAAVVVGKGSLLEEVEAVLDLAGELLERDPDLLRFTVRVPMELRHRDLRGLDPLTEPYLEFFGQLADRAVRRGEVSRNERTRLIGFVTMLLWGITTAAAIEPGDVGLAVRTAKWAAEGRFDR